MEAEYELEYELQMKYGGGGTTHLHLIALGFTLLMGAVVFWGRKDYAIPALLASALLIPLSQSIALFSLDFTVTRIVLLFGWARVLRDRGLRSMQPTPIDRPFLLWVAVTVVAYTLLFRAWGAFVNRLGFAFDAVGMYVITRHFVRDIGDINRAIRALVALSLVLAPCMMVERITHRNLFSVFGGVPEHTQVRGGRLRCQGPFAHPINAGTFGATLLPLAVSLFWARRQKRLAMAGTAAATTMVVTSASSGPAAASLAGIGALCMWVFRGRTRYFVWAALPGLVLLQIVMKDPVWALIARVRLYGSSTAYFRYVLLDQFIRRFSEWWLIGTRSTARWGTGLWDVTSMYIQVAVNGGLLALALFVSVIVLCFREIGRAVSATADCPRVQRLLWSLGASLFAHTAAFMGIAYFDQMSFVWYLLIALISVVHRERCAR